MRNMWLIFRDEVRRVFMNVVSVIIAIGLIAMPSIFAWYNIIACWDVFDNTGDLTVAVANTDEGYQSDLIPIRVNIGDQVVSALRANTQIGWQFTSEDDAVDGARAGRYYAAVVIPKEFSRDMLTFYMDDAHHASLIYYSNEKKSAIAPKITDTGADTVSYEVNQVFAKTVSEVALSIAESLSHYLDDADAQGQMMQLAGHMADVAEEMRSTSSILALYGSLADTSADLIASTKGLAEQGNARMQGLAEQAGSGADALGPLANELRTLSDQINLALQASAGDLTQVAGSVDAALDDASTLSKDGAAALRAEAVSLGSQAQACAAMADQLEALKPHVDPQYQQAVQQTVDALRYQTDALEQMQESLDAAAAKLEQDDADVQAQRDEVHALIAQAEENMAAAQEAFRQIRPALDELAEKASALASGLSASLEALAGTSTGLGDAADRAQQVLSASSEVVAETTQKMDEAAAELESVSDDILAAVTAGDSEALKRILTTDVTAYASALSAPVALERIAVYPADNFGSQMAPLYTTLALFIGSLLIMVVMRPVPCKGTLALLHDAKPRQVFLGHFAIIGLFSLAQTTLAALGNMLFLQVQVMHPWLYLLIFWAAGLVFTFIIYALVVSFANLGKAIAVLMLIVQVTGCGGSFPLQILPTFVQFVSPYLPATYVVNAMREAMMGTYGMVFWQQLGGLLLFLIPAALLGLALRKPLEKLMQWYLRQVDKSELMA